ncbi:hypothetical protein O6H91_22G005600 [Diphasiastrum complanatum]|nr:hypothetical protein O6H91_22G005600 [Diphasiastrum complanatum]
MRNLAYKIKKASRANYILMNIEMSSQAIDGLKALLDKDERVIRHLVMKEKKAITEPTEPPEEYFPTQASEDDHSSSVDENVTDEEGEDEEAEEEEEVEDEEGEDEEEELEEVDDRRDELVLR